MHSPRCPLLESLQKFYLFLTLHRIDKTACVAYCKR